MNTAVIEHQSTAVTARDTSNLAEIKGHVQLVQQVLKGVMKEKTHYDVIPGTDKPTLLKPGAELLCMTFRIAPEYRMEDLSGPDEVRYRVTCLGVHQNTGVVLGQGLGECSSQEEKYKWRRAVCDEEFENTPEERRRVKYARGRNNTHYTTKQIRTEAPDVANTVLKMAAKRAQVAMTLNVTAASDMFSQDLDEMAPELRESLTEGDQQTTTVREPKAKKAEAPAQTGAINSTQATLLRKQMERRNVTEEAFCAGFKIETMDALPAAMFNEASDWIKVNEQGAAT